MCSPNVCKGVFNSNVPIFHPNCAESLHFSAFFSFKKYLHGICDAGSRLLLKFRSGTHYLNEELRRHRGRKGKTE